MRYLIALLVLTLGFVSATASAQTTEDTTASPTTTMLYEYFQPRYQRQRLGTHEERDTKCRTHYRPHLWPDAREVAPSYREERLARARDRHEAAKALTSRCFVDRALAWFSTSGASCVHSKEGAWDDPNAPYWGGMQADLAFQRDYGPEFLRRWGTADHWPIWAQKVMAYRGWLARGWSPWPNTARECGLL